MITFSKRRSGIYKKASELVAIGGAEVGIVAFSPTEKPYSFRHPFVQAVINKFLNRNASLPADDRREERICQRITCDTSEGNPPNWERRWWEKPPEELSFDELKEEALFLEALSRAICNILNYPDDLHALGLWVEVGASSVQDGQD
ncbi:hypothetical protein CDL15_Pgr017015 [Punica granatum]|uniref:MADS-box domain-containing protein n=1 Tax=Punica granatum TaxID=22663 RepID=A0A218WXU2_PUNGR|nr:hypothetical protein CDL15_Pgr017015 [Punica granatum]